MIPPTLVDCLVRLSSSACPEEAQAAMAAIAKEAGTHAASLEPLLASLVTRAAELAALRRLAATDALTGLANRRTLEDALEREVARVSRTDGRVAVLVLDLDGLKDLNDAHGHEAGDQAIRSVANACHATLRVADLAARLGGDEFAVLLPDTDGPGAVAVAARLREAIEDTIVAGQALRVSIGIACGEAPVEAADDLLAAADAAMYREKRARRDCAARVAA